MASEGPVFTIGVIVIALLAGGRAVVEPFLFGIQYPGHAKQEAITTEVEAATEPCYSLPIIRHTCIEVENNLFIALGLVAMCGMITGAMVLARRASAFS